MSIQHRKSNSLKQIKLHIAAWNVRTQLDMRGELPSSGESSVVTTSILLLSAKRISGESEFVESGAGYTFFCIGKPEGQHRQAKVEFAVRSSMLRYTERSPIGISPRIMKLQLCLRSGLTAVYVSAYARTLTATKDGKEAFYESLNSVIQSVPYIHKLFILGDFMPESSTSRRGPRSLDIIPSAMRTPTDLCCYKPVLRMN